MKLLMFVFIFLSINIYSDESTTQKQEVKKEIVKSYELKDEEYKKWRDISDDFNHKKYLSCLKKQKLKMNCGNCTSIFIDVVLNIDETGKLNSFEIIKENICTYKIGKKLKKCFMEDFEKMTFPEESKNKSIEIRLGTGLKC